MSNFAASARELVSARQMPARTSATIRDDLPPAGFAIAATVVDAGMGIQRLVPSGIRVSRWLGEIACGRAEQVGVVAAELPEHVVEDRRRDPRGGGDAPERRAGSRTDLVQSARLDQPGAQGE